MIIKLSKKHCLYYQIFRCLLLCHCQWKLLEIIPGSLCIPQDIFQSIPQINFEECCMSLVDFCKHSINYLKWGSCLKILTKSYSLSTSINNIFRVKHYTLKHFYSSNYLLILLKMYYYHQIIISDTMSLISFVWILN